MSLCFKLLHLPTSGYTLGRQKQRFGVIMVNGSGQYWFKVNGSGLKRSVKDLIRYKKEIGVNCIKRAII